MPNDPKPDTLDLTPKWCEVAVIYARVMLSPEWQALETGWPDVARAFAAADALQEVLPTLPQEVRQRVQAKLTESLKYQMDRLPGIDWGSAYLKPAPIASAAAPTPAPDKPKVVKDTSDYPRTEIVRYTNYPDTIAWKTGRMYSKRGQRMAAVRRWAGILFVDIDRNISGLITDAQCEEYGICLDPLDILWAYDRPDTFQYWVGTDNWTEALKQLRLVAERL